MNIAIVLAGGIGKRMGGDIPKQFLLLEDKPVLINTLEKFSSCDKIDGILVICVKDWIPYCEELIKKFNVPKVFGVFEGGETRRNSSYNGCLKALEFSKGDKDSIVLIHDAARPFVSEEIILNNIQSAEINGACETVISVNDTVLRAKNGKALEIVPRDELFRVQTPQSFKLSVILSAHESYVKNPTCEITDDAGLILAAGGDVALVNGSGKNIKITTKEDM